MLCCAVLSHAGLSSTLQVVPATCVGLYTGLHLATSRGRNLCAVLDSAPVMWCAVSCPAGSSRMSQGVRVI
jgi:hypothetical protein